MVQVCSSLLVSSISSSHSSSSSVAFVWFCRAKCGLGLAKPCVSFYLHKLRRLAPPRRETSLYCSDWVTKRMTGREGGKRNRYNLPKLEQWVGRRSRRGLDGTFTIEGFFLLFRLSLSFCAGLFFVLCWPGSIAALVWLFLRADDTKPVFNRHALHGLTHSDLMFFAYSCRDTSKICRLCLGKEVKLTRPFKDQVGTNTALLQKIYECTTVKVSFPVVK